MILNFRVLCIILMHNMTASIISVASDIASDMMEFYSGDQPGQIPGQLPDPYYCKW